MTFEKFSSFNSIGAQSWLASFPGLAWRIEVPRSRLEIFHAWEHPLLGAKTPQLLQNAHFRHQTVAEDDQVQLTEFWEAIAARVPASAFFRLAKHPDHWFSLQGWPCPVNNDYYNGMLQAVSGSLTPELNEAAADKQMLCRSVSGHPVMLVDLNTHHIVAYNKEAAQALFLEPDMSGSFFSLLPKSAAAIGHNAFEQLVSSHAWSGALSFRNGNNAALSSEIRLSLVSWKGQRLVRVSFPPGAGQKKSESALAQDKNAKQPVEQALLEQVKAAPTLRDALQTLLDSKTPHFYEGLLFSDIKVRKGQVTVYGVGNPFDAMPWGLSFSYEGTIAQNIERHALKYLVVDDTLDSIRSIDWAFLVPKGIRSYFARPFYRGARLHAVLILCSTQPRAFSLANAQSYDVVAPAFLEAVTAWRKQNPA